MPARTGIPEATLRKATKYGLVITTYNPGDGTKYRVFQRSRTEKLPDYFDSGNLDTFLTVKELVAFIDGWSAVFHVLEAA